MEERSLRITGASGNIFNRLSNTLTKIINPTKEGINSLLITMKRNNLLKAFEEYKKSEEEETVEKKYEEALLLVRLFLEESSSRIDEALFLEAQILETKSSVQNIKEAVNDYDIIISDWPQSDFWSKAKKRSTYLKRFYIDIR